MTAVGFEPTRIAPPELESGALDHSAKLSVKVVLHHDGLRPACSAAGRPTGMAAKLHPMTGRIRDQDAPPRRDARAPTCARLRVLTHHTHHTRAAHWHAFLVFAPRA